MAEKRLKSLLKARTILWLASAIGAAVLLCVWNLTGSAFWFAVLVLYAFALGYRNAGNMRNYAAMYGTAWVIAILGLHDSQSVAATVALSVFFGALLFLLLGIMQTRFEEPRKKLGIFYFLLVCSGTAVYAWQSPMIYDIGEIALMLLFLYATGREYIRADAGLFNRRVGIYLMSACLLSAQALWMTAALSIGFLNVATLTLVLYMSLMMIISNYFRGTLTKKMILGETAFFAAFSTIILFFSFYAR